MSTKIIRNIFLFLLGFLGLGAVGGGGTLIISPSGELIGMPLSMLEESPFSSFLIPGVILSLVLGLIPLLLIIALLRKPESILAERFNLFKDMHWAWAYSIYIGFILIIWIHLQMVFIQEVSWIHTFYIFFAVSILYVALLPQIRNFYRK